MKYTIKELRHLLKHVPGCYATRLIIVGDYFVTRAKPHEHWKVFFGESKTPKDSYSTLEGALRAITAANETITIPDDMELVPNEDLRRKPGYPYPTPFGR